MLINLSNRNIIHLAVLLPVLYIMVEFWINHISITLWGRALRNLDEAFWIKVNTVCCVNHSDHESAKPWPARISYATRDMTVCLLRLSVVGEHHCSGYPQYSPHPQVPKEVILCNASPTPPSTQSHGKVCSFIPERRHCRFTHDCCLNCGQSGHFLAKRPICLAKNPWEMPLIPFSNKLPCSARLFGSVGLATTPTVATTPLVISSWPIPVKTFSPLCTNPLQ